MGRTSRLRRRHHGGLLLLRKPPPDPIGGLVVLAGRGSIRKGEVVAEFALGERDQVFGERFMKFAGDAAATQTCVNSQFMPGSE